jgi:hypothetical protein
MSSSSLGCNTRIKHILAYLDFTVRFTMLWYIVMPDTVASALTVRVSHAPAREMLLG